MRGSSFRLLTIMVFHYLTQSDWFISAVPDTK